MQKYCKYAILNNGEMGFKYVFVMIIFLFLHVTAVIFNHKTVFPIMFDGTIVEKWWKSALVFRVYCREAGQHSVTIFFFFNYIKNLSLKKCLCHLVHMLIKLFSCLI